MKKLINDPLLHFLLIGAALFLAFVIFSKPADTPEQEILVTQGDIASLKANFKRTWQRPPTQQELNGLIEYRIRDEIAFREAKAMGLDKDDASIQRRLRLKFEVLVEDIAGLSTPTEADLQDYFVKNRDTFSMEPQLSFDQVYFNGGEQTAAERAHELLAELQAAGPEVNPAQYGDPTLLPAEIPLSSASSVKRQFGDSFVDQLQTLATGKWLGPLQSVYGLHLVFVRQYIPGRFPDLSEVRSLVERKWTSQRREQVKEDAYRKLRDRYSVKIEPQQPPYDEKQDSDG